MVGGCGVQIAAGIVAQQGGNQAPVPGWCGISAPMVGCVAEQFLVAGTPIDTSVGIVANQPQQPQIQAPQPQTAPTPPPPPAAAPAQAGGTFARLTRGANIRNDPTATSQRCSRRFPAVP